MKNYKTPTDIEKEAKKYIEDVLKDLDENNVLKDTDSAAITMLARNYSMFIKASKQLEKDGLTVTSDRGNITPHPCIRIAKDAQVQAVKIMQEFGLTAKARTKLPQLDKEEDDYNPFKDLVNNIKEIR